jgi:site-specific recombinase XerD
VSETQTESSQVAADVIHQLRHSHATELINAGVSIEAVRERLGHSSAAITEVYAELTDQAADAEIRATRRKRETRR